MSGQWEVVGKNKKDKNNGTGSKKLSKTEKKKFVDNAPKVEDLLPLAQVKTLYAALDNKKQPNKISEKTVKTKENEIKKAQKKQPEKKKEVVKEKPPKTLEAAVNMLSLADVENVLEVFKLRFQDAPLVLLKGLATYLNTKLPVDFSNNSFTAKSFEYPLCLLPVDIKNLIKKVVKDVPEAAVQMFFDFCLTSMAVDMTKGSPVSGYKILLQLLATQIPSITVSNFSKYKTLRSSYQNRQAIGSSILWGLGQGGFKDLSVGLKVWQQIMMPVCELRNYNRFVLDYLKYLLARHSTSKALSVDQYLSIVDTISSTSNLSNAVNTELKSHVKTLQSIACNVLKDDRLHNVFEPLMLRLQSTADNSLKDELCNFICLCLSKDHQSYSLWRQHYTKHLPESATLLRHIHSEWKSVSSQLPLKLFKDMLNTFRVTNNEMIKSKQKAEGLQECNRLCEALIGKMTTNKSFPWFKLSLVLFLAICGLLAYDVNKYGSFRASSTGRFLKEIGALTYFEQAYTRAQIYSLKCIKWSIKNVPIYYVIVRDASAPFLAIARDAAVVCLLHIWNVLNMLADYTAQKIPILVDMINSYAPGLIETVQTYFAATVKLLAIYFHQILQFTVHYLVIAVEWFKVNILIGSLSPENLQRYTMEAINVTHNFATQTFAWLNEQIEATSV